MMYLSPSLRSRKRKRNLFPTTTPRNCDDSVVDMSVVLSPIDEVEPIHEDACSYRPAEKKALIVPPALLINMEYRLITQHFTAHLDFIRRATKEHAEAIARTVHDLRRHVALVTNARARKYNRLLHRTSTFHTRRLLPLRKVIAGVGQPLPGTRHPDVSVPALAVGATVPIPIFPESFAALWQMNMDQINRLVMVLNEDIGFTPGHSLENCHQLLVHFLID